MTVRDLVLKCDFTQKICIRTELDTPFNDDLCIECTVFTFGVWVSEEVQKFVISRIKSKGDKLIVTVLSEEQNDGK